VNDYLALLVKTINKTHSSLDAN